MRIRCYESMLKVICNATMLGCTKPQHVQAPPNAELRGNTPNDWPRTSLVGRRAYRAKGSPMRCKKVIVEERESWEKISPNLDILVFCLSIAARAPLAGWAVESKAVCLSSLPAGNLFTMSSAMGPRPMRSIMLLLLLLRLPCPFFCNTCSQHVSSFLHFTFHCSLFIFRSSTACMRTAFFSSLPSLAECMYV